MKSQNFVLIGLILSSAFASPTAVNDQPINNENGKGAPLLGKHRTSHAESTFFNSHVDQAELTSLLMFKTLIISVLRVPTMALCPT